MAEQHGGEQAVDAQAISDLFEIARALSGTLDLDLLLERIGDAAQKLTHAQGSSIMLVSDAMDQLYFKIATGDKGSSLKKVAIPFGDGIAGWCAANKKPVRVDDTGQDKRFTGRVDTTTGFKTTSILAVPIIHQDNVIGVCEAVNKRSGSFTQEDEEILGSLAGLASIAIVNAKLVQEQKNFFVNMIEILIAAIDSKKDGMQGHSTRVARLATAIGRRMGMEGQDYKDLYYGALLHDIGMLSPKLLDKSSREIDFQHPSVGAEMIQGVNVLHGAVPVIRHHHERFDGAGHPDGLKGDQIPLGARIVGAATAYEEMRAEGLPPENIKNKFNVENASRFDPAVAKILCEEISE